MTLFDKENQHIFSAGTVIIEENSQDRKLYVLQKGRVVVYKKMLNQKVILAFINEGEVFGELSFFDGAPRSASVEAHTDIQVTIIDAQMLEGFENQIPVWIKHILQVTFDRFRYISKQIAVLTNNINSTNHLNKKEENEHRIVEEFLRLIKTIELNTQQIKKNTSINKNEFTQNLYLMIGKTISLNLEGMIQTLCDYGLIRSFAKENVLEFDNFLLKKFEEYLLELKKSSTSILLSQDELNVLKKIITLTTFQDKIACIDKNHLIKELTPKNAISVETPSEEVDLNFLSFELSHTAHHLPQDKILDILKRILKLNFFYENNEKISFHQNELSQFLTFQSILKNFDLSEYN